MRRRLQNVEQSTGENPFMPEPPESRLDLIIMAAVVAFEIAIGIVALVVGFGWPAW